MRRHEPRTADPQVAEKAAEAVGRVLAGETEAFRLLVESYGRAVFGLCRRLLSGNDAEAEDLTQETFLRAFERLDTLEDRRRFAPWLFQVARSLCRDRWRRCEVEGRALEAVAESVRRAEQAAAQDPGSVPSALDDLPADEQEALRLRYFEGLPYEDIARRLQLSFSQVDHLIRRARARLSRRLLARQRIER